MRAAAAIRQYNNAKMNIRTLDRDVRELAVTVTADDTTIVLRDYAADVLFSADRRTAPRGGNHTLAGSTIVASSGKVLLLWTNPNNLMLLSKAMNFLEAEQRLGLCFFYLCVRASNGQEFYLGRINQKLEGEELFFYMLDLPTQRIKQHPDPIRFEVAHSILLDVKNFHDMGIYHLDLKPENIMLAEIDGAVSSLRVIDFEFCTTDVHTTSTKGTMGYIPPEHFFPSKSPYSSEKRDVYALGCTLLFVIVPTFFWERMNFVNDMVKMKGSASLFDDLPLEGFLGLDRPSQLLYHARSQIEGFT